MSCNYADGLSPYDHKGKLGLAEKFDDEDAVTAKAVQLSKWIEEAQHVVFHTGAGISTSAGIPDFRGPKGVWTLEEKGLKPEMNISFDDAVPTITHMAIAKLIESKMVHYVISQNIDGLHLRSGLSRNNLAELHGNMYVDQCSQCERQFVRGTATTTVGQKCAGQSCPATKRNGTCCRGKLHDTILDWEHSLPENDLEMSDYHSSIADLNICLGTTLQIIPSGNLPLKSKKHGGRLVICNLQPTKHDRKADLIINSYVDKIMVKVMKLLNLCIPEYVSSADPTKRKALDELSLVEWTISSKQLKLIKNMYEIKCLEVKHNKKRALVQKDSDEVKVSKIAKDELIETKCEPKELDVNDKISAD